MTATNAGLVGGAGLLIMAFFHPRVLQARFWRATVTPLASIIGSGFLVAGPILAEASGRTAWLAMLGLCAIGYLYGEVMRWNIQHVQPCAGRLPAGARGLERASDLALSTAYFISVAYYLNLFAAFGLRLIDVQDPFWTRSLATVAILALGAVGLRGGLKALEQLEVGAVGLKLSVIGGLLAALTIAGIAAPAGGGPSLDHPHGFDEVRILLGLVILVQGFETSRYLGAAYDGATRVRSMRFAQLLASVIYVGFIALVTPLFGEGVPQGGAAETAIIDMLRPIGAAAAPMLIAAALASQSSAAIADMNGASGLLAEFTGGRLSVALGDLTVAVVAAGITWSADIFQIITWASKAFVAYYALQSVQAALSGWRARQPLPVALGAAGVILAVAVITLGKPAAA